MRDSGRPVPTVLLVLECGQGTLKTVRETINKNIPVVVIAGSGRAADLIDYAANNKELYVFELVYNFRLLNDRLETQYKQFLWFRKLTYLYICPFDGQQ
jgi:transient receptor potential cation channel subfamily M protein 2